jgi:hypothetical protein
MCVVIDFHIKDNCDAFIHGDHDYLYVTHHMQRTSPTTIQLDSTFLDLLNLKNNKTIFFSRYIRKENDKDEYVAFQPPPSIIGWPDEAIIAQDVTPKAVRFSE